MLKMPLKTIVYHLFLNLMALYKITFINIRKRKLRVVPYIFHYLVVSM